MTGRDGVGGVTGHREHLRQLALGQDGGGPGDPPRTSLCGRRSSGISPGPEYRLYRPERRYD